MILGVDPGLGGAMAFYDRATGDLEVFDMPTHRLKGKNRIDIYQLGMLVDARSARLQLAVIEEVNAMPKQGVASSFAFGAAFGQVLGVVGANMIPMELIRPAVWKKAMGCTSDKDSSRRRASQIFPSHAGLWAAKGKVDRAEAALLAYYGKGVLG